MFKGRMRELLVWLGLRSRKGTMTYRPIVSSPPLLPHPPPLPFLLIPNHPTTTTLLPPHYPHYHPHQMSRMIDEEGDDVCRLVMGTKFDLLHQAQVSMQDIQAFETQYKVPVMRIKNAPPAAAAASSVPTGVSVGEASVGGGVGGVQGPVGGSTPGELFGLMNAICEQLWLRDQILAGVIGGTQDLPADG